MAKQSIIFNPLGIIPRIFSEAGENQSNQKYTLWELGSPLTMVLLQFFYIKKNNTENSAYTAYKIIQQHKPCVFVELEGKNSTAYKVHTL